MGMFTIKAQLYSDYNLEPEYEKVKSYYWKAKVHCEYREGGYTKTLYSYNKPVAKVIKEDNSIKYKITFKSKTKTTSRHQKEFLLQEGLDLDNINKLLEEGGIYETTNN